MAYFQMCGFLGDVTTVCYCYSCIQLAFVSELSSQIDASDSAYDVQISFTSFTMWTPDILQTVFTLFDLSLHFVSSACYISISTRPAKTYRIMIDYGGTVMVSKRKQHCFQIIPERFYDLNLKADDVHHSKQTIFLL